mmetsp:Transcript_45847/g.143847  ORF Transcript_45847/g.143847 Transcript_45847/m.143847 type:complete len:212 (-) Transcript_45847:997-1632(-)
MPISRQSTAWKNCSLVIVSELLSSRHLKNEYSLSEWLLRSGSSPAGGCTSNEILGSGFHSTKTIMMIRKTFRGRMERMAKVKALSTSCASVSFTSSPVSVPLSCEQSIFPKSVLMSSDEYRSEMKIDISSTARIGNVDASVIIPKPSSAFPLFFPACCSSTSLASLLAALPFITPIPRESRIGTVTGPVVTAPQSHANPIRGDSSGLPHFM